MVCEELLSSDRSGVKVKEVVVHLEPLVYKDKLDMWEHLTRQPQPISFILE
jgi:hypothetical protein